METSDGGHATKDRVNPKGHFWAWRLLTVFACIALGPLSAQATITEIIDATGDGGGNTLAQPRGIAVVGSGNVYVAGATSNNVFKITPGGVKTEIMDATGDGGGNILDGASGIAVGSSGNVYVTGEVSNNALKTTPGGAGESIPALSMQSSAVLVVLLVGAALVFRARGRRALDPSRKVAGNARSAAC